MRGKLSVLIAVFLVILFFTGCDYEQPITKRETYHYGNIFSLKQAWSGDVLVQSSLTNNRNTIIKIDIFDFSYDGLWMKRKPRIVLAVGQEKTLNRVCDNLSRIMFNIYEEGFFIPLNVKGGSYSCIE